jgi:hypothetical protein
MAFESPGNQYSFVAGESLVGEQYHFVKLHTDGTVKIVTAVTDIPIGILQNAPADKAMATVMVDGISKLAGEAAMGVSLVVGMHDNGKGIVVTPGNEVTQYSVGHVLVANTVADGLAVVVFDCKSPRRAT